MTVWYQTKHERVNAGLTRKLLMSNAAGVLIFFRWFFLSMHLDTGEGVTEILTLAIVSHCEIEDFAFLKKNPNFNINLA